MIIPSEEEIRQKEDPAPASTVRPDLAYPPQAFRRRGAYLPNSLPDYETSQALATNNADGDSLFKPSPSRFDRRFWRAVGYAFAAYLLFTIVVGIPIILWAKRHGNNPDPDSSPGDQYYITPPNNWSTLATNFEKILLDGRKAECGSWDHTTSYPTPNDSGITYYGSASRNASSLGEFFLRSNGSYAFAIDPQSSGNLLVTMNPDPSASTAILKWDLQTTDPTALSSVCFSNLTAEGTMLDIQVPVKATPYHYKYRITLMFPQSAATYTVPLLSTSLPYFTTTFDVLNDGPFFNNVNIEGSSARARFGTLRAQNVVVKLGQGDISGFFHVTNSLTLDTMNACVNATVTMANEGPTSYLSIGTGNGPINAHITLAPAKPSSVPSSNINLRTFNSPLEADIKYADDLPSASLQLRASTMLAPAKVYIDSKFQGEYNLGTFLSKTHLNDKASVDPLSHDRIRLSIPQTNTPESTTGWIGWGSRPGHGRGQGSVDVNSSRDTVTLVIS